ncbi:hypothetical protein PENSPDRAFT_760215 [Peniophora sp. CONT]|nr:hypothetical protein PENSPDRAFT_760215 [Peniophora sp. CONT]
MPPPEFGSTESSADPLSFLPPTSVCAFETVHSEEDCSTDVDGTHTANVSTKEFPPFDPADFPPDKAEYGLVASVLFQPVNTNLPVVNIWYDLDMVSEVRDPQLSVTECEMLDRVRAYFHPEQCAARATCASAADKAPAEVESHAGTHAASALTNTIATKETASPPIIPVDSEVVSLNIALPTEPTSPSATTLSREAISPRSSSPTTIFTDEPQATTRQEGSRHSELHRAATTLPAVSFVSSAAATTEPAELAQTSSRRGVHCSTSRTALRSVVSASSVSPTKREFPKHPHPYERSTRSSASTISYAVPRPRHDSLKGQRKSRSSSSLKMPRHSTAVTVPVFHSLK